MQDTRDERGYLRDERGYLRHRR
ncbi:hypothetical protein LCGC14_2205600, partial [marine sediment metagenome]